MGLLKLFLMANKMHFHFKVEQQESLPKQASMVGNFGKSDIIMN